MQKKDYSNIIIVILITLLLFILLFPTLVITEVKTALIVFITKYFPAVFPIYIITDLLINYHFPEKLAKRGEKLCKKIFHSNGNSLFIMIMSMISGFPSGAKYTDELLKQGIISNNEANYLITFTHFSNPLFILGTCYLITKSRRLTILVLICHFLANFLIAFFTRPKKVVLTTKLQNNRKTFPFSKAMSDSIFRTFHLMFLILGTSIIFSVLSGILSSIFNDYHYQYLITGLLELTKGINTLPNTLSTYGKGISILLFLSFGSLSIHMQVTSIIKDTNIKYLNFLLGRISQASISILLFYLMTIFNLV